jgi:glycosyltransferase involved in cell wall biosynthesis
MAHTATERLRGHAQIDLAMVMLNNSSIGGAERRFAQVFTWLRRRNRRVVLVLNETLLRRLKDCQALECEHDRDCIVLPEPMGRLLRRLTGDSLPSSRPVGWAQALRFAFTKLDYLLAAVIVPAWLLRHRPRAMHLVLGGAYVALPVQGCRNAPPAVLSVTNPKLSDMVGTSLGVPLYRLALRRARIVDALTDEIGQMVLREGVLPRQVSIAPGSCVNTNRYRPAGDKQPWVVFSGRFIAEKSPELFVEACAVVHNRIRDRQGGVRFYLLGEGPLQTDLAELVARRGLTSCMQIGWSDRVETILGAALVFVSLQRTDNYPSQALLEAMASGAAVVATDVGLTWKLVDQIVGRRVPATIDAVATAIVDFLDHPARAAVMGQHARDRVMKHHSMEAYLDYLEGLYQRVCSVAVEPVNRNAVGIA